MSDSPHAPQTRPTREDRLAAKLRENLRRRKTQARAMDDPAPAPAGSDPAAPARSESD